MAKAATSKAKRKPKAEPKKLTPKQGAFAMEYVVDMNATRAAIAAGFSARTAAQQGWQLLQNTLVAAEIERLKRDRAERLKIDADQLLKELLEFNSADLADIFDEAGNPKPIRDWPMAFRQGLVAGVEVVSIKTGDDDDVEEELEPQGHGGALKRSSKPNAQLVKFKLIDRLRVKEMIGKHHGVQAWRERKVLDVTDPVKQLFDQIAGQAIRPGSRS